MLTAPSPIVIPIHPKQWLRRKLLFLLFSLQFSCYAKVCVSYRVIYIYIWTLLNFLDKYFYILHEQLFYCVYFVFSADYKNNIVAAQSQCCTEHPELGKCQPGVDDKSPNGKCWQYCMNNCDENKGGFCKLNNKKHHCHCYCWFWCHIYQ